MQIFIIVGKILTYVFSIVNRDQIILNKIFDYDLSMKRVKLREEDEAEKRKGSSKKLKTNHYDSYVSSEVNNNLGALPSKKILIKYPVSPRVRAIPTKKNSFQNNENLINENHENIIEMSQVPVGRKATKRMLSKVNDNKLKFLLTFNFSEIIAMYLCRGCSNKKLQVKYELYQKSKGALDDFLDISFLIGKIEELEKLKLVVLSTDQLALFNFISKEIVSVSDRKIKNELLHSLKELTRSPEELAKIIMNLNDKIRNKEVSLSEVDEKLYNMLKHELKEF